MDKENIKKLGTEWQVRLHDAQMGHYIISERLVFWGGLVGGLIVLITLLITAFTFFDQAGEYKKYYDLGIRVAGIVAAGLSAFQALYKPNEKAEIHRGQAARYGSLKRKVEVALFLSEKSIEECEKQLFEVIQEWEGVALDSPLTKFKILKEIQKKKKQLEEIKVAAQISE